MPPDKTKVPVKVAVVDRQSLDVIVKAPGETRALHTDRIRAPFAARLAVLKVTDGDRVSKGQVLAVIVSRDSEAALAGARQMLAAAKSPASLADARRAVALAKQGLVKQVVRSPTNGMVLSHNAETGDYVDANEVLVSIAETATVYFRAQVSQSDAAHLRPGQQASIEVPALGAKPLSAVVKGLLPVASSGDFTAPVRLDLVSSRGNLPVGLFGTARIIVAHHDNAMVVPVKAVLQNDVTGVNRMAIVGKQDHAHWLDVVTGVRDGNRLEIVHPAIPDGTRVITDGQVGLPEGAGIVVQ